MCKLTLVGVRAVSLLGVVFAHLGLVLADVGPHNFRGVFQLVLIISGFSTLAFNFGDV